MARDRVHCAQYDAGATRVTDSYTTGSVVNGAGTFAPVVETYTGSSAAEIPGPRLPRREVWFELPPEYPEFRVKVWVNYPRRMNDELVTGDPERIVGVLRQIVLEHNGWRDVDGTPFPSPTTAQFWDTIPDELAAAVIVMLREQVGKLASSLVTRSGR